NNMAYLFELFIHFISMKSSNDIINIAATVDDFCSEEELKNCLALLNVTPSHSDTQITFYVMDTTVENKNLLFLNGFALMDTKEMNFINGNSYKIFACRKNLQIISR